MSPRERFERVVAALRADGYTVAESSQPHIRGTLHSASVWMPKDPAPEEQQALLLTCIRSGAGYSRIAHFDGTVTHHATTQWVEPPACPKCEAAHA